MKTRFILLIVIIQYITLNLKAQDTSKRYSPSFTLDIGWVNQINSNGHIDASYGSSHVSGGSDAGLNVYLPIGHHGNGIELMGGYQSNSISIGFYPSSPNPMMGDYFIPCFYFTVPIKKVALLFHSGAGIEGVRIPDQITTYYSNPKSFNYGQIEDLYDVQYYTRCIDANVGVETRYYIYSRFYAGIQIEGLYRSQVMQTPPPVINGGYTYLQIPIFDWMFNFCVGYKL